MCVDRKCRCIILKLIHCSDSWKTFACPTYCSLGSLQMCSAQLFIFLSSPFYACAALFVCFFIIHIYPSCVFAHVYVVYIETFDWQREREMQCTALKSTDKYRFSFPPLRVQLNSLTPPVEPIYLFAQMLGVRVVISLFTHAIVLLYCTYRSTEFVHVWVQTCWRYMNSMIHS